MRTELTYFFKNQMEPVERADMALLSKAGIKQQPFFKSTKGANCLVVFACQLGEKRAVKFYSKDNPLFDQKSAKLLEDSGIGVVKFYGTKPVPKGIIYSGREVTSYDIKSWAGCDFEIALNASLSALKTVDFDLRKVRAQIALSRIESDMCEVGQLTGKLYRAHLLYTNFKPANVAKNETVQLFDLPAGSVLRSNNAIDHARNALLYLHTVQAIIGREAKRDPQQLWQSARASFSKGLLKAGKIQPLMLAIEKLEKQHGTAGMNLS